MKAKGDSQSAGSFARQFVTTRWSVVLAAGRNSSVRSQEALAALCGIYWYPLYAFVRRQGYNQADAQDLTQGFFERLLEKGSLAYVAQEKGRFRSFLLASMKNFLSNRRDHDQAQKRGGGQSFVRLDDDTAEDRYKLEPADTASADKLFERRWALTLLDQVLMRLKHEYVSVGKGKLFEQLKIFMTGHKPATSYAETAAVLGISEGAVKVTVHRMRQRYRELLRDEIAQTVSSTAEIDDEIRYLFTALGS